MKRRIVVKVGTAVLTDKNGKLRKEFIKNLVKQICFIQDKGFEPILVTSGAIATGKEKIDLISHLDLNEIGKSLKEKQALASIGQSHLMQIYCKYFEKHKRLVAQILLTRDDLSDRKRYINIRNTIFTLLNNKIIPIINENDTVSVDEIKFGDNDLLSSLVASKVEAQYLVIITDVEGFFIKENNKRKLVREITRITPDLFQYAKQSQRVYSTGGMITKLHAAQITMVSGIKLYIVSGEIPNVLMRIINNENPGTLIYPQQKRILSKKRWIAFGTRIKGRIIVDKGAKDVLIRKGKSLLPVGVKAVVGEFKLGDTVSIVDEEGCEFARGLTYYPSKDILKIKGKKSSEIEEILGKKDYDEIIHRDNLVVILNEQNVNNKK